MRSTPFDQVFVDCTKSRCYIAIMNILDLLRREEGKTLEFKANVSGLRNILKTVVAFANTAGGDLILGVEDKTKIVCGVPDVLEVEERLASSITDSISPLIIPDIEIKPFRDRELLLVHIYAGTRRPYFLKARGPEKGTYLRVGSTNRLATPELLEELGRLSRNLSFEEETFWPANAEDLDLKTAGRVFAAAGKPFNRRVAFNLSLLRKADGAVKPTVGGYLLFGKNRAQHFPNAVIRCARFKGVIPQIFLDKHDFTGYPVVEIDRVMTFVERNISLRAEINRLRREERYEYPLLALREVLLNAIVHSDYTIRGRDIRVAIFDDRIEVTNPGLLVPGLAMEDLYTGTSKLRNRIIGRVFRELGLIEQWGTGIGKVLRLCNEYALQPPWFQEIGDSFRVTLFNSGPRIQALGATETAILQILQTEDASLGIPRLAKEVGKTAATTRRSMRRLIDSGYVIEIKTSPRDRRSTFLLTWRGQRLLSSF